MSEEFSIDNQELDKLSVDLGKVPSTSGKHLRTAVERTARNVKDTWRDNARGLPHAPRFPDSITYDIGANHSLIREAFGSGGTDKIVAEIGPDKDRPQGALGNLIEYGSVNNSPMGLGHGALQANEADLERGITNAIDDALRGLGL